MNERPIESTAPVPRSRRSANQPLATILKHRRESLELSLSEAEQATRIRLSYLEAIESGDYDELKDDVYSRGYVRNYADYLGLDPKPIMKIYERERASEREMRRQSRRKQGGAVKFGLKPIRSKQMIITPRTFFLISIVAMFAVVVLYIGWQVAVLSAPPRLSLNTNEATSVTTNYGFVSGRVDGGSDLFINDSAVLVAADGSFRERIALVDGRNEIRLSAKNRLGKIATQTYVITATLAKEASSTVSPTVAVSASDQVKVVVSAKSAPIALVVQSDGKEVFRGSVQPDAPQTFTSAKELVLNTNNAGITSVALTNKAVQNQDLGVLGGLGEAQQSVRFTLDSATPLR